MRKVLVTGAGGFIGRHIVEHLSEGGHEVRATDLPAADMSRSAALGAECFAGDLMDRDFAGRAVEGVDGVVHPAAAFDLGLPRDYLLSVNTGTTRNLSEAAARAGVGMFVQFSTCDVYGLVREGPTGEDTRPAPRNAYSLSKLYSEFIAFSVMKRESLPVAVIRPTFVYGPGSLYAARYFILLPSLLARYVKSVPLPSSGQRINAVHVEDVASAAVAVLEAGADAAGSNYNVADDGGMSAVDFLRVIFGPFGVDCGSRTFKAPGLLDAVGRIGERLPMVLLRPVERFVQRRWDRVLIENDLVPFLSVKLDRDLFGFLYGEHYYSNARLKSLGWSPKYPTIAEGWPSTVQWYRDNRFIP